MPRRLISLVGFLLMLQAAALVLTWLAAGAIELNADTSAPISQLRLVRDGMVGSLGELRLARIPSFVPDLLVLRGLLGLERAGEGGELIQARFAVVTALLLLGLQTRVVMLAGGLGRWCSLTWVLGTTGLLLAASPLGREATGLVLSPVHHGGNVLLTLLAAALLAAFCARRPSGPSMGLWLMLLGLVVLGTASNLLFLATAVVPVAITLATAPLPGAAAGRGRLPLLLGSLAGAALAGLATARRFNLQCTVEAGTSFQPMRLLELCREEPLLPLAGLLALALLLREPRGGDGVVVRRMVALAALSPFAYAPFFAEIQTRYLLVTVLLVPVLLPLLLPLAGRGAGKGGAAVATALPIRPAEAGVALLLAAALLAAALTGPAADRLAGNLRNREDPGQRALIETLVAGGHRHGLAGFWNTQLAALSDGRLDIQPVDGKGEPDLWAHNREAFLKSSGDLQGQTPKAHRRWVKPYSFVVVSPEGEGPTRQEAEEAYGPPAGRLGCEQAEGEDACVLLYADPRPIQEALVDKLRSFGNRCSRKGNLR